MFDISLRALSRVSLQGHTVRYLEAERAIVAYALGVDTEQRQQLRTLVDADRLVPDDLVLARCINDKACEFLQTLVHQRHKLKRSIGRQQYLRAIR